MSPNQNFNSGNIIMLSAQQQQQYQIVANSMSSSNRGKVIVTNTNNNNINNNNDIKMQQHQQQQQQQQQQMSLSQQKRKAYSTTTPYSGQQPASVARRNARERNRVKLVNDGFATLREHIPQTIASQVLGSNNSNQRASSKKLSKVETLRLAVQYIRCLKNLISEHDNDVMSQTSASPSPISSQGIDLSDNDNQNDQIDVQFDFKSESEEEYRQNQYQNYQQYIPQRQSPVYVQTPCSEASCSPTPSFASDASSTSGSQGNGGFSNVMLTTQDNYYENMSQEEEELFDYMSLWNQ